MIRRSFVWDFDDEMGFDGWAMVGGPKYFWPAHGHGLAHDVMEHFKSDQSRPEDELMALGALMHVRGYQTFIRSAAPLPRIVADEVLSLARESIEEHTEWLDPGPWRHGRVSGWVEDDMLEIGEMYSAAINDPDENELPKRLGTDEQVRRVKGWLLKGWRRARKRYGETPTWRLRECFNRLAEEVSRQSNGREIGEKLKIELDVANGHVRAFLC